jgi:hypothetical protein
MHEPTFFVFWYSVKKVEDVSCGRGTDAATFAGMRVSESDLVALAQSLEGIEGLGAIALLL